MRWPRKSSRKRMQLLIFRQLVKSFFPSLRRLNADGVPFVHADAPGGTQVTQAVIDAISEFFAEYNSNPTREFATSVESREMGGTRA